MKKNDGCGLLVLQVSFMHGWNVRRFLSWHSSSDVYRTECQNCRNITDENAGLEVQPKIVPYAKYDITQLTQLFCPIGQFSCIATIECSVL